jgi:predicted nucleotidyltransferase
MQPEEIIKQIAEIIGGELKSNYRLFLFGSRAQRTHDEKSDIDIGIISQAPITGKQMMAIQDKIEQIQTLLKIDVVDFNSVEAGFKEIALKHIVDINL